MSGQLNARNSLHFTPQVGNQSEADELVTQAARCRRLAAAISDREASETLSRMAEGYERNAAALRRPI